MEWRDEGIVLGIRRHGESSVIVETLTRDHGRHLGLVRGGRSRRLQAVLQPGNEVQLVWRARLDEHLGHFQVEPHALHAAAHFASPAAIYALQTIVTHLRLLAERDPHPGLYEAARAAVVGLGDPVDCAELLARLELRILDELGFGLDLTVCAATGSEHDLAYVSPKSGRAVSREAGLPYHDRLLSLPAFLRRGSGLRGDLAGFEAAFRLTGHFFMRDVYDPRGIAMPEARAGFLAVLRRVMSVPADLMEGTTA
jgi:DNA repair protein RecO (recombination protein O)